MSTINEELNLLANTKNSIKTAIEEKGVDIGDATFSEYSEKIRSIQSAESLVQGALEKTY